MIALIGDTHGCYKTLMGLIAKLPEGIKICFCGDLVDRGPNSAGCVEEAMKHDCVMGNHEQMMIEAHNNAGNTYQWLYNGGDDTLKSYEVDGKMDDERLKRHLDWMRTLPKFREYKDIKDDQGRYLFVSHAGLPYKDIERACKTLDIMWHRSTQFVPEGAFSVYGHTPQPFGAMIRENHANIDTGAVFKKKHNKRYLTALIWPTMELITQENVEEFKDVKLWG